MPFKKVIFVCSINTAFFLGKTRAGAEGYPPKKATQEAKKKKYVEGSD